jgi:hypothetical protein
MAFKCLDATPLSLAEHHVRNRVGKVKHFFERRSNALRGARHFVLLAYLPNARVWPEKLRSKTPKNTL